METALDFFAHASFCLPRDASAGTGPESPRLRERAGLFLIAALRVGGMAAGRGRGLEQFASILISLGPPSP